jgi:hypothetical protein
MEVEEHFYSDDPSDGHPDVRTRLSDTDYFFLGNGHIQAAVQVCRSGEGSPLGLLVMDPTRFGPKRAAFSLDHESGLENTAVELLAEGSVFRPSPSGVVGGWHDVEGIPLVRVTWTAGPSTVVEEFFCPCLGRPRIVRNIKVLEGTNALPRQALRLRCLQADPTETALASNPEDPVRATLVYEVQDRGLGSRPTLEVRWEEEAPPTPDAVRTWRSLTTFHTSHVGLNHLFRAARNQLPAAVDEKGRMDGSIWQYNLEWVRDQSHVAEALVRLGDHRRARTMLARLLDDFVSGEGGTIDSGQARGPSDVELDQNGELLSALGTYVDWTGDLELVIRRWDRIRALASFPFQDRFLHSESGMLHNQREYWERHGAHGVQDGFELMSQFFVALGLERASGLADSLGKSEDRDRWARKARALREAFLEDPLYRLIENGRLIKRRGTDGVWQREIRMPTDLGLPDSIPLLQEGPHFLDPDTSASLLIAHEFIDPFGDLAKNTLDHVEELWSQWWPGGGYGRYHASGEPDSPGAWPFASVFVARAYVESGEDRKAMRILEWLLDTQGGIAGAWFENDGPRIAPPYPQVGIPPWTWAELITLFVHHILGLRPDTRGITLRPRLLEGVDEMTASLRVRDRDLTLFVRRASSGETPRALVDGTETPWDPGGFRIPLPSSDISVEITC